MQIFIGWLLLTLGGALYLAQIISSISFPLAQRLGIQEQAGLTDSIVQRSERYTAYWDLLSLLWLPLAGGLMIIDHHTWPIIGVIGGAIYWDTSGREIAKYLSLRHEGVRLGGVAQQKLFFASYWLIMLVGLITLSYSLSVLFDKAALLHPYL